MREYKINILRYVTIALMAITTLWGCAKEGEDNEDQRDSIVSYLTKSHTPKLIAESEVSDSVYDEPDFYTIFGSYAYRYITNFYDINRVNQPVVTKGSKITLTYSIYPFTNSAIDTATTLPTFSNDVTLKGRYEAAGLNVEYWKFEPTEIVVGSTAMIEPIQQGLIGCRQGDIVEIYATCNMAYGSDVIGLIEKDSAIAVFCNIVSVN